MSSRKSLASWKALEAHAKDMKPRHLKELFAQDAQRFDKFSRQLPNVFFDYSKNQIDDNTQALLLDLARECDIESWRDKMFAGDKINITEGRAVLHSALRCQSSAPVLLDGHNVKQDVAAELAKIEEFVGRVRRGDWKGYSGKSIRDVVCIGIGGSNLGPLMVTEALNSYSDGTLNIHYVSNVDGVQVADVLRPLHPESTMFVVSSKTFTTSETMTNAHTAQKWLQAATDCPDASAQHFVAVSTNITAAVSFGVAEENIFTMWDWVGGRFSLWSAIGLPIALFLGFSQFKELLEGACEMDQHFCEAPLEQNGPLLLAMVGVWNGNFLGHQAHALLPYDQSLHRLPAYMQQAEMESNGKSTDFDGNVVDYQTGALIWGEVGINGQHAFYQFMHQGTTIVPADFIGSVEPVEAIEGHHDTLMANYFAQMEALMNGVDAGEIRADLTAKGKTEAEIATLIPHKIHRGNRPTNALLMEKITPRSLGSLIALYESKIFVQGIIWNICSFDQWGVELGKVMATKILPELANDAITGAHDSSTVGLINRYKKNKNA
tara:strand:+ start:1753 stop:3399 length:1647 start_codon:yes stop_codon:yes gene_type:complete